MLGGFTFKGIHSSVYGVRETPGNRVLSPLKRRNLITIPGRSKAFIEQDGGYEPREESIVCSYVRTPGVNIHEHVRKIAGWLDGIGELTFDYEPNLHYNAFLSSPPPTVTMLEYAVFTLDFTINHPFAYEKAIQKNFVSVGTTTEFKINVDGTVRTPVRIIIKNNNLNESVTSIKIYHRYIASIES